MAKHTSRQTRFAKAVERIADPRSEIEGLRDELQDWLDGMPENLQGGSKADELQEAIGNLEDLIQALEEAEMTEIEFPGMF